MKFDNLKGVKLANKYMKKSLAIKETQIKITLRGEGDKRERRRGQT
jgi:hypothetical protein